MCFRGFPLLRLQTDDDDDDDDGEDVGMCYCLKLPSMALSPSCLFPPPCSHLCAIDQVADYKSTAIWATLQVS